MRLSNIAAAQRQKQMRALLAAGLSRRDIASRFGLSYSYVRDVCKGSLPAVLGKKPKLTPEQRAEILSIQALRNSIPTNAELAKKFGVSITVISYVARGREFKHDSCHEYRAMLANQVSQ